MYEHAGEPPSIPNALRERYADWEWLAQSMWVPHSVTYRLSHPSGKRRYLKLAEGARSPSLDDEVARTQWARAHLPVPTVLEFGRDQLVTWMVTVGMPGRAATDPMFLARPHHVVQILATGLRRFHAAPVDDCPFDFRLDEAMRRVESRAANGSIDARRDFHPEHDHLSVGQAILELEQRRPPTEDLVVCHGDYCFPNALVEDDRVVGFVDLGELAVADRWWDLAVATWSTSWNLGPRHEEAFLAAYGVDPDYDRIAYYRLLYDLVS